MNMDQQIENYEQIQDYLQRNNIHGLFSQLVQQVILQKPANVLDFMIQQLEAPEKFTLFVVGPPGLSINSIIKKALTKADRSYELFNCGDEIIKIHDKLKEEDKMKFSSCLLIAEQSIENIIKMIEGYTRSDKNYIIEGFPKNLKEALILQKNKIYVKNVLVINIDDQGLHQLISNKVNILNPNLSNQQKEKLIERAEMEHRINMNSIKSFYKKYMEIDLSKNRQEQYVISQLNKAFTIKTIQSVPRISSQIIIVGAPFSGRTTLGKKIADHYSFVYISTSFLIAQEIRKDSIHGRKIKNQFINNELIDNFLIQKLIQERVSKKDCRMQGFVLQGYPKNMEQFDNIKNMKLTPTLIVAIDTPKQISNGRNNTDSSKFNTRYDNWKKFQAGLKESKEKIFWVDPLLSIGNLYEEVIHEFEKAFN